MENERNERKKIKLGNLYFYEDDLNNPLVFINNTYKNAIFTKNADLKNILNQKEMLIISLAREIAHKKKEINEMEKSIDNIEEQKNKQDELNSLIKQYNEALEILKLENQKISENQNTNETQKSENTEDKKNAHTEIIPQPQTQPPTQMQTKKNFSVEKGYVSSIAQLYNIPPDIANMYFMLIDDQLYIKHQGLLFLASKKGYQRIEVESTWNSSDKTWYATARVYPKIPLKVLEMLKELPEDERKLIIDYMTKPTIANATANIENVRNPRMHSYLKEMSETRAINRALRLFTGYGGTSYEELDSSELDTE